MTGYAANNGSTPLASFSYTCDAGGRISGRSETVSGTTKTVEYGYDPAGRLTSATDNRTATMIYRDAKLWIFVLADGGALWLSLFAYERVSRLRPDAKPVVVGAVVVSLLALFFWAWRKLPSKALLVGIVLIAVVGQISLGAPHDIEPFSRGDLYLRVGSFFLTFVALFVLLLIACIAEQTMEKFGIISRRSVATRPPSR